MDYDRHWPVNVIGVDSLDAQIGGWKHSVALAWQAAHRDEPAGSSADEDSVRPVAPQDREVAQELRA